MYSGWRLVSPEQILRELVSGIPIAQNIRVVEAHSKLIDDRIRIVRHVVKLRPHQRDGGLEHGAIRQRVRLRVIVFIQFQLAFEYQTLGVGQIELHG